MTTSEPGAEQRRLAAADAGADSSAGNGPGTRTPGWRDWGPYLAERAWGSVREDYSENGDAWNSFSHDQSRSRVYRWNEDGMAGFCDQDQNWCLSLALWNGVDPILKERMFGLTSTEGNHGEDVKEYWWYTDATPTHSWNSWRYHYPQEPYPYDELVTTNASRTKYEPEYELVDTGIFDHGRYWVVTVDYAKEGAHELLMRITVRNAGSETATLRVLPTFWFRNIWSWGSPGVSAPQLSAEGSAIVADSERAGMLRLEGDGTPSLLFCDNETNTERLWGTPGPAYPKDGINDHVVSGAPTVNPARTGTKAALDYEVTLGPGESRVIRVRLTDAAASESAEASSFDQAVDTAAFDRTVAARAAEADEFWAGVSPPDATADEARILRQAQAGLLWSKQFYHYDVKRWLSGDAPEPPPPVGRALVRNGDWPHLSAHDVMLMPDTWEYPWFASWDLAFHCVTLAHIDPRFAKDQLILLLREWYMHPSGQLPAYEWNFSDVNPPTHAWAALQVFEIDGGTDFEFLGKAFQKLVINFTWWTNTKGGGEDSVFGGGFMGLDNISPLNRSTLPPSVGTLEQADSTAWMAMYALDLLNMALKLSAHDRVYEDVAITFVEHFLRISAAQNASGMWDDDDAYFYDILHLADGREVPLRVRSLVGLVPVLASLMLRDSAVAQLPDFRTRLAWFLTNNPAQSAAYQPHGGPDGPDGPAHLLALVPPERLVRILANVFDERGLLSPHGIRGISAIHREHPFVVDVGGVPARVDYEAAESTTGMFGGNSNWRGPVWFPLNVLLIEALRTYETHSPGEVTVEFPVGSGIRMTLGQAADALSDRLVSLFVPGTEGARPSDARYPLLSRDPLWAENLLFYEYFDGDTGEGLGASHQTGWTAAVAHLLLTRRRERVGP
ncbi:MAG: glucosidase [Actinomycetota bacterium]|nr:glucosidase [Actinomycetota bacterium]